MATSMKSTTTSATVGGGTDSVVTEIRTNSDDIKIPPIFVKLYDRLHHGLFGLLFALQRKSKGVDSIGWVVFLEIFEMLQLLSFPFKAKVEWSWNEAHTRWWIVFVNYTVPETLILGNSNIFYVAIALLGVVLLNAFLVGYYFSRNKYKFVWTLRYLRIVLTLFVTILYIPVIALFTSMIVDCPTVDADGVIHHGSCWTGAFAVRSVIVIFVSLIYIILTMTFTLAVFQQDATDRSEFMGRPHSRIEFYTIIVKTILTISYVFVEHNHDYKWLLVVMTLIGSISVFGLHVWFIPLYRWRFDLLRACILSNFTWASFCLLFVQILDDPERNSITIMYFFVLPIIFVLAIYVINLRKNMIKAAPITAQMNPLSVELKARFMLEDVGLLFLSRFETGKDGFADDRKAKLAEVSQLYTQASELLPNSSILYMFWSNFAVYHCNNKQRSLVVLAECEKRNPQLDEQFVLYRQRKIMNEESSDSTDMLEFIICESYMKKAQKHERKALSLQIHFWSELSQQYTDLQKLFSIGSVVNAEISQADYNYSRAYQSAPKSINVLKQYAYFLLNVTNNVKKSHELAERARQMEDLRRRTAGGDGMDLGNLMAGGGDGSTALFTITHKGIILSASGAVHALYGYEQPSMLLGQNINILVPPPFNKVHDEFLARFLNKGEGQIISRVRKVFGIRSDGYMIPVMILVRQLTFGTAAKFLGVFKAVPEGTFSYDYILLDGNGFIKTFTDKCTSYFGSTPADVNRYQMHVTDWIENFEEVSEQMMDGSKHSIELETDEGIMTLQMSFVKTVIAGFEVGIIKIIEEKVSHMAEQDAGTIKGEMPMHFYVDADALKKKEKKPVASKAAKDKKESTKDDKKEKKHKKHSDHHKKHHGKKKDVDEKKIQESDKAEGSVKSDKSGHSVGSSTFRRRRLSSTSTGSKASGQSTGTSGSAATMNTIMRTAFASRIEMSIQSLRRMKQTLGAIMIGMCIIAVVINIVTSGAYRQFVTGVQEVEKSGSNLAHTFDLLQRLQFFEASRGGQTQAERDTVKDEIITVMLEMRQNHFDLFNTSNSYGDTFHDQFILSSLSLAVDEDGFDEISEVTLNDGVSAFSSRVSRKADDLALDNPTNLVPFGIISSAVTDTIFSPMQNLTFAYLAEHLKLAGQFSTTIYLVSIIPMAAANILALLVITGIFQKVSSESKILYRLFLDIPKDVIIDMNKQCKRILTEVDSRGDNSVVEGTSKSGDRRINVMFDIEQYAREVLSNNSIRFGGKMAEKSQSSDSSSSFKNFAKLMVQVLIIVVVTGGYCLGFSIYADYYSNQHEVASSSISWASFAAANVQEVHYRTMVLFTNDSIPGSDSTLNSRIVNLKEAILELSTQNDIALYGSTEFGLDHYIRDQWGEGSFGLKHNDLTKILFDSTTDVPISTPACLSLDNGIYQHGLYNALAHYVDTALDIERAVEFSSVSVSSSRLDSYARMVSLETAARDCFFEYFDVYVAEHYTPVIQSSHTVNNIVHIISTIGLALALYIVYRLAFAKLMASIEREVALTPSMLLMLPPTVLMKIESIKEFTKQK